MSPSTSVTTAVPDSLRQGLRLCLLAVVWLGLWRVSVLMEYAPHASIWFPPAGVTLAAFLVLGWRALPVIMGCAMAATFWVDALYQSQMAVNELVITGLLFGLAHCGAYGLGAGLLNRWLLRADHHQLPVLAITALITFFLASLLASVLGIGALVVTGMLAPMDFGPTLMPWWTGDLAGALVLTPLCIALLSWRYPGIERWLGGLSFQYHLKDIGPYCLKLAGTAVALSALMAILALLRIEEAAFAIFFLLLPQMWIVYTESAFRSMLSLTLLSALMAIWTAYWNLVDQALVYQFAICVIAASSYLGLAVPMLVATNRQLKHLSMTDPLTQVANRARFFEYLDTEVERAHRYEQPLSLIVFDLDNFKRINDLLGHSRGDEALIGVVDTLRPALRQSDLLARFGGDEFMLLLPGEETEGAQQKAEQMRQTVQQGDFGGSGLPLALSLGVATLSQSESARSLFQRADRALLAAKRDGRNRVVVASID